MKTGVEHYRSMGVDYLTFHGPITDVHMHPRLFDKRFPRLPEIPNGKAGIDEYTRTALLGAITMGLAMPNESLRVYSPEEPDQTKLIPYPITTVDRLLAAVSTIEQGSRIKMGVIVGVDREAIGLGDNEKRPVFTTKKFEEFFSNRYTKQFAAALKIYGADTTGGYNIPLETIIPIAKVWAKHNPGKPVVLHLEDEDVDKVLSEWPPDIPVHVAHVSSKEELEAVIIAQDDGKDVTCEATPHHMHLTEATREAIGPLGCMKPSLKSESDRKFLWDNLDRIAILASDCAPHRVIDKFGIDGKGLKNPAFGVTNHDVFLPLYFQDIHEGRLSENQLFERVVTNPINRFNLPFVDRTTYFELTPIAVEDAVKNTEYGCSPFVDSSETPPIRGRLIRLERVGQLIVKFGVLVRPYSEPRYQNVIRFA